MGKPYSPPVLVAKKSAALARGDFDFLLPYEKELLRPDEVAKIIGREIQYVRELGEQGRLEAFRDSAFGSRKSSLFSRRSVLLYLAEIANDDPGFFVLRLEALLKKLNPPALDRLIATARKLRERIR